MTTSFALVFLLIFCVAFASMALILRVPADQKVIRRRLAALRSPSAPVASRTGQLLRERGSLSLTAELQPSLRALRSLNRLITQSASNGTSGSVLLRCCISTAGAGSVFYWLTGMWPLAMLAGILLGSVPLLLLQRKRRLRLQAFEAGLPDGIDTCARALRAGQSLAAAIGIAGEQASEPVKHEFTEVFKRHNFGLSFREAFHETLERTPSADLRVFVTAILVQKDTGGNLAEIFEKTANVVRERVRIQADVRTHTAQGRLTAWILCLLPVVLLLLLNVIDRGYSRVLVEDPLGRKLLYAGALFLLVGICVIRRIVQGVEV